MQLCAHGGERIYVVDLQTGQHPGIERALDVFLEARVSTRRGVRLERRKLADAVDAVLDRCANPGPRIRVDLHRQIRAECKRHASSEQRAERSESAPFASLNCG